MFLAEAPAKFVNLPCKVNEFGTAKAKVDNNKNTDNSIDIVNLFFNDDPKFLLFIFMFIVLVFFLGAIMHSPYVCRIFVEQFCDVLVAHFLDFFQINNQRFQDAFV